MKQIKSKLHQSMKTQASRENPAGLRVSETKLKFREMTGENELEGNFVQPELSIKECRDILSKNGEEYTDEEIKEIRILILKLVEIDFHYYQHKKKEKQESAKVIALTSDKNEYRQAG